MKIPKSILEKVLPYAQPLSLAFLALLVGVLFSCSGCAGYSHKVTTEGGGTLSTRLTSFGSKMDLSDVKTNKRLGPDGLEQTISVDSASTETQIQDLVSVFLAGSQLAAAANTPSNQGPDLEIVRAILDKVPDPEVSRDEEKATPPIPVESPVGDGLEEDE